MARISRRQRTDRHLFARYGWSGGVALHASNDEVAVAPSVVLVGLFVEQFQSFGLDPAEDLLPGGVVVVPGDVAVDDFAEDSGKSSREQLAWVVVGWSSEILCSRLFVTRSCGSRGGSASRCPSGRVREPAVPDDALDRCRGPLADTEQAPRTTPSKAGPTMPNGLSRVPTVFGARCVRASAPWRAVMPVGDGPTGSLAAAIAELVDCLTR